MFTPPSSPQIPPNGQYIRRSAAAAAASSIAAAAASSAAAADRSPAAAADSDPTAAYNASIVKLKQFIESLETETRMKNVITIFDLNKPKIEVVDVTAFADTVIGVLKTLAQETFGDGPDLKYPYAADCIAQINNIKAALTAPKTGGGMKQSRQSRSRSRNRNRSKSEHGRSKRR